MLWRLLADGLALIHLAFVLYVVFGGLLVTYWPRSVWLHLPSLAWGVLVEFSGGICPLTPLENYVRAAAGMVGYGDGFIDHYLRLLLYPGGLTRTLQLGLGVAVLLFNLLIYLRVWGQRKV